LSIAASGLGICRQELLGIVLHVDRQRSFALLRLDVLEGEYGAVDGRRGRRVRRGGRQVPAAADGARLGRRRGDSSDCARDELAEVGIGESLAEHRQRPPEVFRRQPEEVSRRIRESSDATIAPNEYRRLSRDTEPVREIIGAVGETRQPMMHLPVQRGELLVRGP
jgi:hypothetical protein